jgi:hypothetical protein
VAGDNPLWKTVAPRPAVSAAVNTPAKIARVPEPFLPVAALLRPFPVPEEPVFHPPPPVHAPKDACPLCWVRHGRFLGAGVCICHDPALLRFAIPE